MLFGEMEISFFGVTSRLVQWYSGEIKNMQLQKYEIGHRWLLVVISCNHYGKWLSHFQIATKRSLALTIELEKRFFGAAKN